MGVPETRVRAHDDDTTASPAGRTAPAATASPAAAAPSPAAAPAAAAGGADADRHSGRPVPGRVQRPRPDRLLLRGPRDGDLPDDHHVRDLRLLRLLPTHAAHA